MTYKIAIPLIAVAGLTACAQPKDSTLNRADYRAFAADDQFADRQLPRTAAADIPTGEATYAGHIRSNAILNNEDDYKILGDLELVIDIEPNASTTGSGDINGTITNINLLDDEDDGFEDQRFGGFLNVDGDVRSGEIEARATGVLDAVLGDVVTEQKSFWELELDGKFVTDLTEGDTIVGDVSGGTEGGSSDEYNIRLDGSGAFLGERQ